MIHPVGCVVVFLSCGLAAAGDIRFQAHPIDPDWTNSAAGVIDVNRDGRLDVVSGEWSDEAPDRKNHDVSDVQEIRGHSDD